MILMIDNYDSFTYNLVQYFGELEPDIRIHRNDAIDIAGIRELNPDHIVISPGPGTPHDAGISMPLIKELGAEYPILGVCLGHQSIGAVYGGDVVRAERIMHGKLSAIHHNNNVLLDGMPNPFQATRYHSLIIDRPTCPDALDIIAWTDAGEIMGVAHKTHPVWGVQFHPESILTEEGKRIVKNFMFHSTQKAAL
ncbi:MAG: aminodeoxychorismate/anthranilate synthase component II [Candidatus Hydrogenedentes bacterium]|nr:aminodeoxychorismate/anthranilate synthase component II [Candidatus Hydrogenedentota bacterium]